MYTLLHATHYTRISIFFYEVSAEKNPIVDERHRHFQGHELTTTTAPQASACTTGGWMVQVVAPRQSAGVGDVSVEASRCGKEGPSTPRSPHWKDNKAVLLQLPPGIHAQTQV